ncbi:IS607 family transposase [Chromatium okenii]|jgi:predicted site-specific integrase-resolvase|uniref:IS607 family transposase n=1 Tax=Chromatium okenii TaxID=61644 RepID=A0A2S7XQ64_9GAMM|nr:IS607 family transposase [Chromatium okenii]PQJ95531.1 IS607 family transposase [Chromatium okenii]
MEKKLVKIGEAAKILGTCVNTLRRWEASGELVPTRKTQGGTRYYSVAELMKVGEIDAPTVCYARVSSHDQKEDLQRQQDMLEAYCAAKGWRTEVIADLGSGMNYRKKAQIAGNDFKKSIKRLVITHKDRLLRFGAELVFALCEAQGIEIIIIHKGEQPRFEEELAKDVLEIITVFSARLYGSRSHKNKQFLDKLNEAVTELTDENVTGTQN